MSNQNLELNLDPYKLRDEDVKEPPIGWKKSIKYLGPGLVVSAAVVGSGEVIAVPVLGAQIGMYGLWLVLLACLIKIIFLEEFARFAVTTGKTPLETFATIPGPRLFNIHWIGWVWILSIFAVMLQQGGVLGTAGGVLMNMYPALDDRFWASVLVIVSIIILYKANYDKIENASAFMVAIFTLTAIIAVVLLQFTPYRINLRDIAMGFSFTIPKESWYTAFGVFGMTGISAIEIVSYHYWCLEKGYARNIGPKHNNIEWKNRALGWISVMQKDITLTASIFTFITLAFYLLGAKILKTLGVLPSGINVLKDISHTYTEIFGGWSLYMFMIGAFIAMYSTFFSNAAAYSRFILDFLINLKAITINSGQQRNAIIQKLTVVILIIFALGYFAIRTPVALILFGGVVGTLLLPILAWATVYLNQGIDKDLSCTKTSKIIMYCCTIIVTIIAVITLYDLLVK